MGEPLYQEQRVFSFDTQPHSFLMITFDIDNWLAEVRAATGTVTLFVKHTSASLTVQENADPTVRQDLIEALEILAPYDRAYRHHLEGRDDMPGHIKTMLTDTSLTVPVTSGQMALDTWQGVYLIEHRGQQHRRQVQALYQGTLTAQ